MTWLESKAAVEAGQGKRLVDLASAPSAAASGGGVCKRGCKWLLPSRAASERHDLVLHTKERRLDQQRARRQKPSSTAPSTSTKPPNHCCAFVMADGKKCDFVGSSGHYLRVHKENEGHSRKRKSGNVSAAGCQKSAKA